ncbi:MAG: hypothetical protein AMXMBFR33_09750 [Candidatus Xenobia bacterium]
MPRPLWALCALLLLACSLASPPPAAVAPPTVPGLEVSLVVGPFDLHRRYRSMEGPYVMETVRISDLVDRKETVLGPGQVKYVEGGFQPSMQGACKEPVPDPSKVAARRRKLYWVKSFSLDVLDEKGNPMPSAEFICHMNLDVNGDFRDRIFPESEPCGNERLLTLTQGQTTVTFPKGFALPVASDEQWTFTFQAANRTTDEHRLLRHRLRIELVEDKDLLEPIQPLAWITPYLSVVVDKNSPEAAAREKKEMPGCLPTSVGLAAPNSVPGTLFDSWCGQRRTGHWVVPPGRHTYQSALPEIRSHQERVLRLVWSHVHPLMESVSLIRCGNRQPIFTVKASTRTKGGLELESIELLSWPQGLKLPRDEHFELQSVYNNTTPSPQDSMVALGVFFDDTKFARPAWVLENQNEDVNCSVPVSQLSQPVNEIPLFDVASDGPLLETPKRLELETSEGRLRLVLDPKLAPVHATQIYRLLTSGVYDQTPFTRYERGFVLQTANAEQKLEGSALTAEQSGLLRRLPLEARPEALHKTNFLSMARYEDPTSAVSSFSILLGPASHLDGEYTVFGWVESDPISQVTLKALTDNFQPDTVAIKSVRKI